MKTTHYLFLLAALPAMLIAQSDRGALTGAVSDAGGAVIPNVAITATHKDTNTQFKTTTTSAGEFNLSSLPVGAYRVVAQIEGFRTSRRDDVMLEAGATVRLDTKLEVGAIQQSVQVSAQTSDLQTEDEKIMNTISDRLIEGLPTVVSGNLRSPFDPASITAQVNGGDQDFRIGGGQAGAFGVMLDGASGGTNRAGSTLWAAVNVPSLEAITEFSGETNGFKAEFGRAGGGLGTFVSKGRGNRYHGQAFGFL